MKNLILLILVTGLLSFTRQAETYTPGDDISGQWTVTVPQAPVEYQRSTLTINENEGKLSGKVKFDNGDEIFITSITFKEGKIKIVLSIDYSSVLLDGTLKENIITGKVESSEGILDFTACRKEIKTK